MRHIISYFIEKYMITDVILLEESYFWWDNKDDIYNE